jgi:hypothetical protein
VDGGRRGESGDAECRVSVTKAGNVVGYEVGVPHITGENRNLDFVTSKTGT